MFSIWIIIKSLKMALSRKLGLFATTMYGVGLILGAGIYVLIGEASGLAGEGIWISFMLAAIVSVFTGLSYAELSSLYPKAAAEYVYVKNVFRNNFLAFMVGWLVLFTAIVATTAIAFGFGGYLSGFVDVPIILSAIILMIVLAIVNFIGIRESSGMNIIFTLVEAAGLVFIIYLGFVYSGEHSVEYFSTPFGFEGILAAFVLVLFAYVGFENIANISEETKNPRRTIPRAIILSIIITSVIYILVALAAINALPIEELANSSSPIADIAGKILGSDGYIILSLIALFATTNTVLIMAVAGSRILYGITDGGSFPSFFSKIHNRTKTPWVAIVTCTVISIIFAFSGDIATIASVTVFTIVIVFVAVNFSVIWLRLKEKEPHEGFRTPFSIRKVPVLPVLGVITSIIGISLIDVTAALLGLLVTVIGMTYYFVYGKNLSKNIS